jgi:hypothetical protein
VPGLQHTAPLRSPALLMIAERIAAQSEGMGQRAPRGMPHARGPRRGVMRQLLPLSVLLLGPLSCAPEPPMGATTSQAIGLWGRYVSLSCEQARSCCAEAQLETEALDLCEQELARQLHVAQLLRFVDDGSVLLEGQTFQRCLDQAERRGPMCAGIAPLPDCFDLMHGLRGEGEPCEDGIQCAAPDGAAVCLRIEPEDTDREDTPGTCHNQVRGALGDPCLDTCTRPPCLTRFTTADPEPALAFCFGEDGLYCDWITQACAALRALDEACSDDDACGADAFCSEAGRCQPRPQRGERCDATSECAQGLVCAGPGDTCALRPAVDEDFCAGDYD